MNKLIKSSHHEHGQMLQSLFCRMREKDYYDTLECMEGTDKQLIARCRANMQTHIERMTDSHYYTFDEDEFTAKGKENITLGEIMLVASQLYDSAGCSPNYEYEAELADLSTEAASEMMLDILEPLANIERRKQHDRLKDT